MRLLVLLTLRRNPKLTGPEEAKTAGRQRVLLARSPCRTNITLFNSLLTLFFQQLSKRLFLGVRP
jgi:hypothetical protein